MLLQPKTEMNQHDILIGRGIKNNLGHKNLKALVTQHIGDYYNCSYNAKPKINSKIITAIQNRGGIFLIKKKKREIYSKMTNNMCRGYVYKYMIIIGFVLRFYCVQCLYVRL